MLSERQIELLNTGQGVDIELIGEHVCSGGIWELYGFLDDVEYFWGSTGVYAGSIGRTEDGRYYAAPDDFFRKLNGYLCVWYR